MHSPMVCRGSRPALRKSLFGSATFDGHVGCDFEVARPRQARAVNFSQEGSGELRCQTQFLGVRKLTLELV
jgi:hypothetical protein